MGNEAVIAVESVYRADWGRIIAALISLLGDFDLAEEYAQEAFTAALNQWPESGVPDLPGAWIVRTAHNKAIDRFRRQTLFAEKIQAELIRQTDVPVAHPGDKMGEIPDERLRLIFTCCHPALATESQVALTLRTLCGLETEEIARAFLVPTATMAQRLVRAKRKIRGAGIPYAVPVASEMTERLDAVLTVIYLVFNEGYAATRGEHLVRTDLVAEAIRLQRLIIELIASPAPSEAVGLLALMLLHDARQPARTDAAGDIVVLEDQDRSLWNREQIKAAIPLVSEALARGRGPYALQAAISAEHCKAARAEDTDWRKIVQLYEELEISHPSPVIALNHAVALAMAEGPSVGLAAIDAVAADLDDSHLLHAARADLLRRLGNRDEATLSYGRALKLVTNDSERRYLKRRLREVQTSN
ncbi:MAG: putative polymerase, sigma-24 subunit, subfamily [Acidobacteriales bacterium]|nr:putative polymerase, sigma-24 subunit, subfamily [Terriglobales bacterium]